MRSRQSLAMRNVAIVQARMGSSRLPGKVLKKLAGRPVLDHVVSRVKSATRVNTVIVATSTEPQDDAIEEYCSSKEWSVFRGSETDVLSRFAAATETAGAEIVIRVTSDCPFFSPFVLDEMLEDFEFENTDYMSTNYPVRSFPVGLDCEVMRAEALMIAAVEANDPYDREHVTPFLYHHPERFIVKGYRCPSDLHDVRVTLDTLEDHQRLAELIAEYPELGDPQSDVLKILRGHYTENT